MALEAQDNPFTSILMVGAADPEALSGDADPSAGSYRLVMGTDDKLYILDETGNATEVGAAAGSVATDAIFDAAGDLVQGTGANTAARLAIGAAGTVLGSTGSAAAWQSGGMVLLETRTASASASLDLTTFISSTYDEYVIEGVNIIAATNAQDLLLQCGSGAGPTWDTGNNYNWGASGINGSGTAVNHNGTTGLPPVFNSLANAAGYGHGNFTLRLFNPQSATLRRKFIGSRVFANTAVPAEHFQQFGIVWTNVAAAMTGVRFIMTSGNITSGIIRAYGIVK